MMRHILTTVALLAACSAPPPLGTATGLLESPSLVPDLATHPAIRQVPLCPLPSWDVGPDDVIVTAADASWAAVRTRITSGTRQILLTPGDYTALGTLAVGDETPLILRYYDPGTDEAHPVDRRGHEALIEGVIFMAGSHDWTVHGVTLRQPSTSGMLHVLAGNHHLLDGNLIEDSPAGFGIRIRDGVGVCAQANVIRNGTDPSIDQVGINVKPNAATVVGVRIVNNEIADWVDAIQMTAQQGAGSILGVQAQIVGNDLYTTTGRHAMDPATGLVIGCTENAIDLKAPAAGTTWIVRNRMWGYRETAPTDLWHLCAPNLTTNFGASGDAITIHVDATDIVIDGNEISDSVTAVRASNRVGGRRLTIRRNVLRDIPAIGASTRFYGGAALVLEDDASINGNILDGVPLLCPRHGFPYPTWPPAGYNPAAPRVTRNVTRGAIDGGACSAAALVEESPGEPVL